MKQKARYLWEMAVKSDNTGIALILIILCVVTSLINPSFASKLNIINMLRKLSQVSFISLSMAFVMIGGGIDLSVGSVVGLGGVVSGALMVLFHWPMFLAILASLLIGALFGLINGVFVAKVQIPPFIVTLGTMYVAEGLVNVISQGKPIYPLPEAFINIFSAVIFEIPVTVYAMILFVIVMHYLLNHTVYGRSITATGGNERAAATAGIDIAKTRIISYVMMGLASAFTGLLLAARMKSAHPASGSGWEMTAIAATVIGGTSVKGGIGSIVGTLIGAAIMAVLEIAMTMIKVSVYYQKIVVGLIIIVAVVFDQAKRKKRS